MPVSESPGGENHRSERPRRRVGIPTGHSRSRTGRPSNAGGRLTCPAAELTEQASVRQGLADKRAAILSDLGGEAALSRLQLDLVDRYVELDTVASRLGGNLVAEGPLTAKGRTRAALSAYLAAVDRVHRLATALGLARRQKTVSLTQYLTDTYPDTGSAGS